MSQEESERARATAQVVETARPGTIPGDRALVRADFARVGAGAGPAAQAHPRHHAAEEVLIPAGTAGFIPKRFIGLRPDADAPVR